MTKGFSSLSRSRGLLKGTGAESQLTVCVILNADQYDARIMFDQLAATLITGSRPDEVMHAIPMGNRVFDLQADDAPLVLRGVPEHPSPIDSAQLWSFIPVVELPVEPGTYKIISSHARLVLDLSDNGNVDTNGTHTLNIVPTHLQPLTSFR